MRDRLVLHLGGRALIAGAVMEVADRGLGCELTAHRAVPLGSELVPVDRLIVLAEATRQVGLIGDEQHLACVWLAAVLGFPLTRKLCGFLCDLLRACGVRIQHTLWDSLNLIPAPIRTPGPPHTELTRQRATHTRLHNPA